MILKLFTQPSCGKCPAAKNLIKNLKLNLPTGQAGIKNLRVEEYDTSTVEGLAEASFYTVMATPTILLCDDNGKIIKDFRGKAPALKEILSFTK